MSYLSQKLPERIVQGGLLLLSPSTFEEDPAFRETLTQVTYAGLRWGGGAAFLGLLMYVGIELLFLDAAVRWGHLSGGSGPVVDLSSDLLLATLCVGTALLPSANCSLNHCRGWVAAALLIATGVFLRSDILRGTIQFEFVALLYLVVIVVVPYRPWQVFFIGLAIGALVPLFSWGDFLIPEAAATGVQGVALVPSLGTTTVLATLISVVLYATRLAQHRERQRAQASVRRSRDLLQRTQEVAGVGGWEYNPGTGTIRGTEYVREILNLSTDREFDLNTFLQAFEPEARETLRASLRRCIEEEEPFEQEFPRLTDEGEQRWIHVRAELRSEGTSLPNGFWVAGTVQDVTEQRMMERELREREEWLRSITENVPDGICRSDPEEGLVYANQALARMFGYEDPEDMLDLDPADLYANPDTSTTVARQEEHRSSTSGVEVEFQRNDGTTFTGLLNRREVLDENGEVRYYDAVVTDITDQIEREEARRKRRERLGALYSATGKLLRAQDPDAVARQILQLVGEEFGCTFGDVFLRRADRLVSVKTARSDDRGLDQTDVEIQDQSLLARAYRSGETIEISDATEAQTAMGYGGLQALSFVPVGDHGLVVIGTQERGGISSFSLRLLEIMATHAAAVLDRIEREQKLLSAKEEAEEASRLKTAMLANMSHEIRTPLTAIIGFAEILKNEVEEPHADRAERIYRSGERLLQTLTSLVQLSKLEAGAADLEQETIRLDQAVEETLEMLRPKAQEKSLTIEREVSSVEGVWNGGAINRIITNLVENAIKFTPEDGWIRVSVEGTEGEGILVVEDSGIGMSPAFQEHAFDAFKQESEGKDRTHEGTGLGLSIVCRLVQALGGSIELESERGQGTRFTVRLPRAEGEADPSSAPESACRVSSSDGRVRSPDDSRWAGGKKNS